MTCPRCERDDLTEADFGRNAATPTGRHYYCRECCRAMAADWRRRNLEYDRKRKRGWRKAQNATTSVNGGKPSAWVFYGEVRR